MTERDLKKLNRVELLEMLLTLSEENEALVAQVESLEARLEDRRVRLEKSGSIAEAAISISQVFQAAQTAADLYLDSIRLQETEYRDKAKHMLESTQRQCDEMTAQAQREVDQRWQSLYQRMSDAGVGQSEDAAGEESARG